MKYRTRERNTESSGEAEALKLTESVPASSLFEVSTFRMASTSASQNITSLYSALPATSTLVMKSSDDKNVKFSLYPITHNAVTQVSGEPHAPAVLPSEMDLRVTFRQETKCTPEPVCLLWRKDKIFYSRLQTNPHRSCSLVAIAAKLLVG
jgi:hypothetical protein